GGQGMGATGLRFGPLDRYLAPAWGIQVRGWPTGVPSAAEVWWADEDIFPAGSLQRSRGDFANPLEDIVQKEVSCWVIPKVEQATVVVESVRTEKRKVQVRPGKEKEEDCLVVRLSYPKGKPFYAEVPSAIGGQEHRFYTDAGKYTGVFFPITQELARS